MPKAAPVLALALLLAAPALAAQLTVAEARASLVGKWSGKIEYRDYQTDRWFGLPVTVEVKDGGDGVTLVRTADYDDGPATGIVRITTVSILDGAQESVATFRKGRPVELQKVTLSVDPASRDKANWTMVETSDGTDDDRPATIRVTTVRSGPSVTSTKEVRFTGEDKWLTRNRTVLKQ